MPGSGRSHDRLASRNLTWQHGGIGLQGIGMGAWSADSFGNDDACDWASELEASADLSVVESALDRVLETGDAHLEAPDASQAIVAVESIARLQGNWGNRDSYSATLDKWVGRVRLTPSKSLAIKAHKVLDRILSEPSGLLELWRETEEFETWYAAVRDLMARVKV